MASASALPSIPSMTSSHDKRPKIPFLKTPMSATSPFPSELRSPLASSIPSYIRRHEDKTPITPPAAYLSFLQAASPAVGNPADGAPVFSFTIRERNDVDTKQKGVEPRAEKAPGGLAEKALEIAAHSPSFLIPPNPFLSRSSSAGSASSVSSLSSGSSIRSNSRERRSSLKRDNPDDEVAEPTPAEIPDIRRSPSPSLAVPTTMGRGRPVATMKRLQIPKSPSSTAVDGRSPLSILSGPSPIGGGTPWSACFSPTAVEGIRSGASTAGDGSNRLRVRTVVSRTVTYSPIDAALVKRRRLGM